LGLTSEWSRRWPQSGHLLARTNGWARTKHAVSICDVCLRKLGEGTSQPIPTRPCRAKQV
jgi:hypothetical protein